MGLFDANFSASTSDERAEKEALLTREACAAVDDITFGARAGLALTAYSNVTDYIAKYSKDLRSAIENTSRLHAVDSPALGWELHSPGNAASLKLIWKDQSFLKYHRYAEFVMFSSLARIRTVTQTNYHPLEIRFLHDVGKSTDEYARLAGCPVIFGTSDFEILLSPVSLDIPIPTYDDRLKQHLTEYSEKLLLERRAKKTTLKSQVEGVLLSALPAHMMRAEEVALEFGMSLRTFSRKLGDEDTTFRQISESVRQDLAITLLKDGMSLAKIAFTLGYSDQAAFSNAFKRWTGVPPGSYV